MIWYAVVCWYAGMPDVVVKAKSFSGSGKWERPKVRSRLEAETEAGEGVMGLGLSRLRLSKLLISGCSNTIILPSKIYSS